MTLDNEIRTAQAVQYRKLLGIPIVTTQRCPKNGADPVTGRSVSARDPELRKYDTAYPNIGIYDGRATYLSCLQRGDDMDIAQRVVDWDRKYPRVGNELAATDKYPARNVRPWERSTSSIEAPAVHPLWYQVTPSPTPDALKLPPKSPLPQSQHTGERIGSRPPIQKLRQLNLRSATGSLSPRPTCEVLDDQFTSRKAEKTDTRKHSLVSYLTEGFLRDEIARNLAQADYIRNQNEKREVDERKERRRKEQEKEKAKQERAMAVKKKRLEDVPAYIKDLARNWRERYPGPDKLFRKDFDFGPKTQGDDDDDYCRPLSPHSSCHSLSKAFTNTHSKSLKRQRHDSSNPDVARESPHDRYSTMSSPIPMQRSQPTTPISRSFSSGVGAPEAHPGQLVDFTLHSSPRFEVDYSNKDRILFLTSKYDRNHVLDYFETRAVGSSEYLVEQWAPDPSQVVDRDSCCAMDLRYHLETVFNEQGNLTDNVEEAQAAVDEAVRIKTCKLQRKPRTTRDQPPVLLEPISRTRTAEPQVTKWSPIMYSKESTHSLTHTSTAEQHERIKRRGSYVIRCRSTDAFLRDILESQTRRQLARTMKCEGHPRKDIPGPRYPEQDPDDWLGDDPL